MKDLFKNKLYYVIIGLIVLFGIFLRLKAFLVGRSLWHDEASLAINILHKSFLQFFLPLEHYQSAPPLFMAITKLISQIFNTTEFTLRFIPFLCGTASVPMFFLLSENLFDNKITRIVATTLFVVNYNLIYYAQEFKQYSSDVFWVILLSLILPTFDLTKLTRNNLIFLGISFLILPLLSLPTLFVIGAYLILQIAILKKQVLKRVCVIGIYPIIAGLLICFPNLINNQNEVFLKHYFENLGFLNFNPIHILAMIKMNFNYFFFPNKLVLIGILLLGWAITVLCKTKSNKYQNLLLISFTISILASFLHIYPLYERVSLYLIPSMLFLLLIPLDCVSSKNSVKAVIITILTALYFGGYLHNFWDNYNARTNIANENAKDALQYIIQNYREDDIIVYNTASDSEWEYYSKMFGFDTRSIRINLQTIDQNEYNQLLNKLPKDNTYWFYYPYSLSKYPENAMLESWASDKIIEKKKKFQNSIVVKVGM